MADRARWRLELLAIASSIAPVSSDQWHTAVGSKLRAADTAVAKQVAAADGGAAVKQADADSTKATAAGAKG